MSNTRDTAIHLIAGGLGGTIGAVLTCPLEVVKTRLQSSQSIDVRVIASLETNNKVTCKTMPSFRRRLTTVATIRNSTQVLSISNCGGLPKNGKSIGLVKGLRLIVKNEGFSALFRGLGPNLVGVAPSRAIYFCAYSQSKDFFNSVMPPSTPFVHLCSAGFAGFTSSTATNPIWFVKTRLQLDRKGKLGPKMTAMQCARRIYRESGIKGFYKGITASYFGISETVVHFVIYEEIKAHLVALHNAASTDSKSFSDFFELMLAAASSKTIASCIAYPHEVARTRLREEGSKYVRFWQTLSLIAREEGYRGLYRGLSIQLLRQIPNTAIMMSTYEGIVYILSGYFAENEFDETES